MAIIVRDSKLPPSTVGVTIFEEVDTSETSTTSNTVYENKVKLITPSSLAFGNYVLQYQFLWRAANADREADFQITLDSAEIIQWSPSNNRVNDIILLSGFFFIHELEGSHTIDFNFKRSSSSSNTTIFVRDAKLFLMRIL